MDRIREKEGDWLKLIPEESSEQKKIAEQQFKDNKKKGKEYTKPTSRIEAIKIEEPNATDDDSNQYNYFTIWDLPANINSEEIKHICKNIRKAQVIRIKRSKFKALAVIRTDCLTEENIPWSLPIGIHKLVRVTKGNEDYKQRDQQSQFTTKLRDLPANASEVLLLRCLKSKGAKSVYISPNRNGNQRRSATITFASKEEMDVAKSKLIRYNNHQIFWDEARAEKKNSREDKQKYRNTEDLKVDINEEEFRSNIKIKNTKSETEKNTHTSQPNQAKEDNISDQMQELLQKILLRLDRLETHHICNNASISKEEINYS
jgi:hypothetical protein